LKLLLANAGVDSSATAALLLHLLGQKSAANSAITILLFDSYKNNNSLML
jgi:hypothetical protein